MTELILLRAASTCIGSARNFAAVIQQIIKGKRALIDQQRVLPYQVLYVVDATKSFFKVVCWGDVLPPLHKEDHDDKDIELEIGDLVVFSACTIKSFRGNVEAQFTKQSRVQLLYRRDRYFNTRDVRLKDIYPMIEWYKQHRHEFFLDVVSDNGQETTVLTNIRDLREDMVVNVECTVRKVNTDVAVGKTTHAHTEFSGVLLCELVMTDAHNNTMALNLWDQHAENRFVKRLLAHSGTVKIRGLIVTLNSATNQLHCNTTPRATFAFDHDQHGVLTSRSGSETVVVPPHFSSVDALDSSPAFGRVVLDGVSIEQVMIGFSGGHSSRIEPQFTPLLVESYCSVCTQTLPTLENTTIPHLYGPCRSRCRAKQGTKERMWRYRPLEMILRDAKDCRLPVHVASDLLPQLVGNISAELLILPAPSKGRMLPFNVRFVVAKILNALVEGGGSQKFRVELVRQESCRDADGATTSIRMDDSMDNEHENNKQECRRHDTMVALEPSCLSVL